jgi:hypothetical protein
MNWVRTLTVTDKSWCHTIGEGDKSEADDREAGHSGHQKRPDVAVMSFMVDVDGSKAKHSWSDQIHTATKPNSHHDRDEGSIRDLEKRRLQSVEAKALDDQSADCGLISICHGSRSISLTV